MTDLEGQEVELENTGSEAEPLSLNLSDTDGTLSGTFTISGLDAGSYLLFVTVKLPDGDRTAVDAMRLLPGVDAVGTLTVVSMNDGDVADEGLTVDDLIGDLLEFSVKVGTTYNISDDPDDVTFNGSLKIRFPSVYRYKFYIDGVEWTDVGHGGSGESSFYQIKELNSLTPGRHVMSVIGYTLSTAAEVGSVDIILDKLEVGLEKNIFKFELNSDGQSYAVIGIKDGMTQEDPDVLEIPSAYMGLPVTEIGEKAFYNRSNITGTVKIPDSVTKIGEYAFSACRNMTSINIPDGVTSIDAYAFSSCDFTSIIISNNAKLMSIGYCAFQNCKNLTNITIPENITQIGERAFYGCSSLTNITIPKNVTTIESYTFYGCSDLASIIIPDSITSIGANAFRKCSSLTNVTIPEGVKSISEHAFQSCNNLTNIVVPDGVISIGNNAFRECRSLTSIFIPDSVTSIEIDVFYYCDNLTDIYCASSVMPEGWNSVWLGNCDADVFWGASRSDYDSIIAGTFDVTEPVIAFVTDGNATITSDTSFAHIYYTTDGSDPTAENGTLYEAPFSVEEGKTVKAVAYVGNGIYSDVVAMEAPQQLPAPTLTSRYDGSVYRVYLNNAADYPEQAQVYFRYVCDELDPDPGFTLRGYASEFNGLELYDTGGFNTGTAECYIVCEGYQQSETASLQLEEKQQLPTPELSYMHRDKELVIINYESYFDYDYSAGDEVLFMGSYEELEDSGSYEGAYLSLNDYSEGSAGLSDIGFDAGIDGTFYVRATCLSGDYKDSDIAVYTHSIDN